MRDADSNINSRHIRIAGFAAVGTVVDEVKVQLSFGIIDRFSEGLYSSPNKAFEELVTNSFDAGAEQVWVYLPQDLDAEQAVIAVIDDGESMSADDLHNLWWIGRSQKRTVHAPKGRPDPIGKFGIGKLATYVLATSLTYIVHRDQKYFAVSMDYSILDPRNPEILNSVDLLLDVVELTRDQAFEAASAALAPVAHDPEAVRALRDDTVEHWTVAVLGNLKPAAREIKLGKLRWILRTALPLSPQFRLALNDATLTSSKSDKEAIWTFTCGVNDSDIPSYRGKVTSSFIVSTESQRRPAVVLPKAGHVSGVAHMYRDSLKGGKSEHLGRSHGFFVRVRGRLINTEIEEGNFGIDVELRHGTLSRFFMEVEAPDLDSQIASARETLKESEALDDLKSYLLAVFNRARIVENDSGYDPPLRLLSRDSRLSDPPQALTQGPLRRMLMRAAGGEESVQTSLGFNEIAVGQLATVLEDTDREIVEKILLESSSDDRRFISYDPSRRAAILNADHPFVSNYSTSGKNVEPLKLLGLAELVTEAYMLDEDVAPIVVSRIVRRRDAFLRALVARFPRSATVIAQQLRDARNKKYELEDAVGDALELLGYSVRRLGGAKHGTDGVATARLGQRVEPRSDSYAFTYDAKSSGKLESMVYDDDGFEVVALRGDVPIEKVRADTARTSILRIHRETAAEDLDLSIEPDFTLLVAPDYQGGADSDTLIARVCENDGITPIRVDDFADLVELFPLQGLNPSSLRDLFNLHSPKMTQDWVKAQRRAVRTPKPRIDVLIKFLVQYSETKSPITLDRLAGYMNTADWDEPLDELEGLVRGLHSLAPNSFYFDGSVIALNATPEVLYEEIRATLEEYGNQDDVQPYLSTLSTKGSM